MERFNAGEFFADTGVLDRLAGDVAYRQRRATTGISIEFGQYHAGQRQRFAESLGGVDCVLAEHGVDDEQGFNRMDRGVQFGDFAHHRFVDGEAPGGIDQQHVVVMFFRPIDRVTGNVDRLFPDRRREAVGPGLCRNRFQLLDGRRAINVAGDDQHFFLLLFDQELGQFADGRRFARALQTGHQDDGRWLGGEIQPAVCFAHQGGQFAMDDADQCLAGTQRADDFFADSLFLDRGDEGFDGRQRHVGFEQGQANFAQRVGDIGFGQAGFAAQGLHYARQALGQVIEHLLSGLV